MREIMQAAKPIKGVSIKALIDEGRA